MKQFLLLLLSASLALGDTFTPVPTRIVGPGGSSVSVSSGDVSIQPQSGGAVNVVTGTMYVPTIIDFSTSVSPLVSGSGHFSLAFNGTSILSSTNGGAYAAFGGSAWGGITGTLSAQTDLQTALNAKQGTITFGTGIQTALGVNIGSAGAPVLFNGAGGTPSSLTLTNATGLPNASVTGLGALATVTPGTGVATAAAIAVNTAGGQLTHGGAGAHTTLTTSASTGITCNTTDIQHLFTSSANTIDFDSANVMGIRHTKSNGDGASAIAFLRYSDGFEMGAIGYKNNGATSTYLNDAMYIASGIYSSVDGSGSATIIPIVIGQESTGGVKARITFTSDKSITFHNVAGTVHSKVGNNGGWHIGSDGATATTNLLDCLGTGAFGSGTVQSNRNSDGSGKGILIDQSNGAVMRLVKSGVVGMDLTINGTGATRRIDWIDKDNSSVVPLSVRLDGSGGVVFGGPARLKGYTVATLPAGTSGDTAYVTDALTPALGTAVVGGGAVKVIVLYDGTNWTAQ